MTQAAKGSDAKLLVRGLSGPVAGRLWTVLPDRPLVLGREVPAEGDILAVSIPDPLISSRHCRIEHHESGFRVVDLNSTNGVQLNGRRVSKGDAESLADGDVLSVANVALKIRTGTARHEEADVTDAGLCTEVADGGDIVPGIVTDLFPYPIAMCVRRVLHAMAAPERVNEVLRSFEVILQFQALVALSEYTAGASPHDNVRGLLDAFQDRPFSVGRWFELHGVLTRALTDDRDVTVEELQIFGTDGREIKRWKKAVSRLVEIRNDLLHGDGITAESAQAVDSEMTDLFAQIVSALTFWMGYRFISVEGGNWSDAHQTFDYPTRLMHGCSMPFEARVLRTQNPLPTRVPIILSRDNRRRLSLAPFQWILPADDQQAHWFWLAGCARGKTKLITYPASFKLPAPDPGFVLSVLSGEGMPSGARQQFAGTLSER